MTLPAGLPNRYARLALTAAWALLILAACSIPGRDIPDVQIVQIDKAVHFTIFAVLGWLGLRAGMTPLAVLAGGIGYAILTELYQGILPWSRTPDFFDALANSLGLLAAVLFYYYRSR